MDHNEMDQFRGHMLYNPIPFCGFGSSPGQESGSPNESHRVCTVRFSSLIFSQHLIFKLRLGIIVNFSFDYLSPELFNWTV